MINAPISARCTASLALVLYVCAWWTHAISQRKEVCGSGPHTLNQTDLDVYLLQDTYVILQSVPYQHLQGDTDIVIIWSAKQRNRTSLLPQQGKSLNLGPMDQTLTLLNLTYTYYKRNQSTSTPLAKRKTAVLHLATASREVQSDQGFAVGQTVQVFTKSLQRVYCFKTIPYNPVTVSLWKRDAQGALKIVSSNRYYNRDSCLWMNSLQQIDSGSYSLDIESCFSKGTVHRIDFSLSVTYKTETTDYHHVQDASPRIDAAANRISRRVINPGKPLKLNLNLSFSARAVKSGHSRWNVSLLVNMTLTIQFEGSPEKVLVRLKNTTAKRFIVDLHNHTIKLEKVQRSDQELYRVVAFVGERRAKVQLRIIVIEEETAPSTANLPTTISLIAKSSTATNSSPTPSGDKMEHTDGIQGWVIGIIILCILLILAIPTVYFSYKHRQFLRLHFDRCCRSKEAHSDNSNYEDSAYANTVIPSASSSQEKDYVNTVYLPDVVAGAPKQQACEIVTTNEYDTIAATSQDQEHGKETRQTQETVLYASVTKKKKGNYDPSSSESPKNTTSTEQSDFSKNQPINAEQTALVAEADEKVPHVNKPHLIVKDTSGKERNVAKQSTKKPIREPPPPPVPHRASRVQPFEKEEGPVSPDNETPSKPQTEDRFQATAYAEISTPVQTNYPEKQSGQDSKRSTEKQTIQYVELDVTALSKRM